GVVPSSNSSSPCCFRSSRCSPACSSRCCCCSSTSRSTSGRSISARGGTPTLSAWRCSRACSPIRASAGPSCARSPSRPARPSAPGPTIGSFLAASALASLMHKPFRGHAVYYIIFILPMLTVPVVVSYTAEMMLYSNGPVNGIISVLTGVNFQVAWLTDPNIALLSVALLEIWNWTPFSFIIMLAGLAAIPKEPIEAAEILGASKWRIFWEVQVPLLRPVIMLALVLRFLEAMAEFPKTWALFQGGPGSATETLPVYIFMTTWQYFEISKGAAMSYVVMMLMIVIVLAAIHLLRREKRSLDAMYATPAAEG